MSTLMALGIFWFGSAAQDFQERKVADLPSEMITDVFFSPDGGIAGYSAKVGEKWIVFRGAWTSKPYELALVSGLSQDGKHIAYYAAERPDGTNASYLDGKIIQEFNTNRGDCFLGGPILSGDGTTTVQIVTNRKEEWAALSINGKLGKHYKGFIGYPPAVSSSGKAIAFAWSTPDYDAYCVVDELLSAKYEDVLAPALSADGKVVAYVGGMLNPADKYFLHVDDKKTAIDGVPKSLFMSPDGKAVGLVIKEKSGNNFKPEEWTQRVVVDGKRSSEYRSILNAVFDSSGKKVAFRASDENRNPIVVVSDRAYPAPGIVFGPMFSKDGKSVGYGARLNRELWWKVIDIP